MKLAVQYIFSNNHSLFIVTRGKVFPKVPHDVPKMKHV